MQVIMKLKIFFVLKSITGREHKNNSECSIYLLVTHYRNLYCGIFGGGAP